jgi:hypothetical protein
LTWLEKYNAAVRQCIAAVNELPSAYLMLKAEKGYLNSEERARYIEAFDHYLSLRNDFDHLHQRLIRGEIRHHDPCE